MVQASASRLRTQPLERADYRSLLWAGPPLAVLGLAHVLFEIVGFGYAPVAAALATAGADPSSLSRDIALLRAGLGWGTTALVFIVVGIGAAIAAWSILASRVRGRARIPFLGLAAGITVLGLAHLLAVDALDRPLGAIFHVTRDSLAVRDVLPVHHLASVALIVGGINVMSVLVPALLVAAATATALPPLDGWNAETLARRARQVREFVAIAAAFMVAGVVHMGAWTHWAGAALLDKELESALTPLATAVTLFWGAAFTLMIASFYLPMAAVLSRLAADIMDRRDIAAGERPAWLAARGLSFQFGTQLPQIAAMAAPLLASPLAAAIRATADHALF
ncbi:MAG: hypothetical protein EA406_06680 [Rhodospirillales bacterium]|nr:MAG: hypothetical protein EA406_06680 [Rhodospirillales bacterium]